MKRREIVRDTRQPPQLRNGNAVRKLSPDQRWEFLANGLMSKHPDMFLRALKESGVLAELLPEVDAWYGVPQMSDNAEPIDVGEHQERVLAEASRQGAELAVRFAALMHKVGKGTTPREIWPSHYKHEVRGHAALNMIAQRFRVPPEALELAHLAIDEGDRVHRASLKRAGALTLMVARIRALEQPTRFEQLLTVCTCDYAAYEGHSARDYPKADIVRRVTR